VTDPTETTLTGETIETLALTGLEPGRMTLASGIAVVALALGSLLLALTRKRKESNNA
jgi:hypothetical protein